MLTAGSTKCSRVHTPSLTSRKPSRLVQLPWRTLISPEVFYWLRNTATKATFLWNLIRKPILMKGLANLSRQQLKISLSSQTIVAGLLNSFLPVTGRAFQSPELSISSPGVHGHFALPVGPLLPTDD